jgi:hypothetical protein
MEISDDDLIIEFDGARFRASIEAEWQAPIDRFFEEETSVFDDKRRLRISHRRIETSLVQLDSTFAWQPEHEYSDVAGNKVIVSRASPEFSLSLIRSNATLYGMAVIKRRLKRRAEVGTQRAGYFRFSFKDLLVAPVTAKYFAADEVPETRLVSEGMVAIKASLFKLSMVEGECWDMWEAVPMHGRVGPDRKSAADSAIPKAVYNEDLVRFYKIARSSEFASQIFLSFYHILEYHFLRVSDELLHTSIKAIMNEPTFNASYDNVNKLLATLKKNDCSSDETEMLKAVLKKYVDEDELIAHIADLEKREGRQIYTETKRKIFGEQGSIRLERGHALQNTARAIKQIRNALVHSSDRYNREDCFLPFSESESVVVQYIPVIQFLAEKVIYATAE